MHAGKIIFAIPLLMGATVLHAAQPATGAFRRDGAFWVQTLERSEGLGAAKQLRIRATGSVLVHGSATRELRVQLIRRVRAQSEGEARDRLRAVEIGFVVRRARASLEVGGEPESELRVDVPQSLEVVTLSTRLGNLEVAGIDGSVHLETGAGRVSVHRIRGNVSVDTAGGPAVIGDIGGLVYIDSGGGNIQADVLRGNAILQTAGGDISVQSVAGTIRAFTGGGGIRIRNAGSVVTATTAGGPIEISSAKGAVTARNSGGPIHVGSAHGVVCESQSGTIRLNDISGTVHVETQGGSVIAQLLEGRTLLPSSIETMGGDITVYLPGDVRLTLRAETERPGDPRSIVSDFPGVLVHADRAAVRGEGALNGGGPVLRLAGNGLISIKRR